MCHWFKSFWFQHSFKKFLAAISSGQCAFYGVQCADIIRVRSVQCANIIKAVCILWAAGWRPFDAPSPPPPRIKLFFCTWYQSDQKDCNTLTLKPIFQSPHFSNHRVSPLLQRKAYMSTKLEHIISFTQTSAPVQCTCTCWARRWSVALSQNTRRVFAPFLLSGSKNCYGRDRHTYGHVPSSSL